MQFSPERESDAKTSGDKEPSNDSPTPIKTWKILIVDDDQTVHDITRLVLKDYTFDNHSLHLTHVFSAEKAKALLNEPNDYSVIFLDVVMETDNAGLELVNYIRNVLCNQSIRIILRTGQPGVAPELSVIFDYDINDYKEKTDLTYDKMHSCLTTALRSYRDINTIKDLAIERKTLQGKISKRNKELLDINEKLRSEITERAETELKLKEINNQLKSMIDNSLSSISIKDCRGRYNLVNKQFLKDTGFTAKEVIGKTDYELFCDEIAYAITNNDRKVIDTGHAFQCEEVLLANGENKNYLCVKFPLFDAKENIYRICSMNTDITERLRDQNKIAHMAQFDTLTDLPNRSLFMDRVSQAISRIKWKKQNIAILFIDLDRFKTINDSLGHDVGDQLLIEVSKRLKSLIRDGDSVCRLGGDEFALLLVDIFSQNDIVRLTEKIVSSLLIPYHINNRELVATPSIGISRCPVDGSDVKVLLKKADVAMYKAKKAGKNTYRFYLSEDDSKANMQLSLEADLRKAIDSRQFYLAYQPKVSLEKGEIYGYEALLRWTHSTRGSVPPAEFIPVLEETGLILEVGVWVLTKACIFAKKIASTGYPTKIAVNLSPLQFKQNDFFKILENVLESTGCSPEWLELELTEGALIDDFNRVQKLLYKISRMGILLAIDDFGTGYSSMNYLKRLPFDTLKIDRSFIVDAPNKPKDHAIVMTIAQLAHNLRMKVVAEGVETIEQYRLIKDISPNVTKCEIQGFIFSEAQQEENLNEMQDEVKAQWKKIGKENHE